MRYPRRCYKRVSTRESASESRDGSLTDNDTTALTSVLTAGTEEETSKTLEGRDLSAGVSTAKAKVVPKFTLPKSQMVQRTRRSSRPRLGPEKRKSAKAKALNLSLVVELKKEKMSALVVNQLAALSQAVSQCSQCRVPHYNNKYNWYSSSEDF